MGVQKISSESHSGLFAFGPGTKLKNTNSLSCTEREILKCQNSIVKALSVCIATIVCTAENRAAFVKAGRNKSPVSCFNHSQVALRKKKFFRIKMLLTSVTRVLCLSRPTVNIQNVYVNIYLFSGSTSQQKKHFLNSCWKSLPFQEAIERVLLTSTFFHVLQRDYCRTSGHIIPCLYTAMHRRGVGSARSQVVPRRLWQSQVLL